MKQTRRIFPNLGVEKEYRKKLDKLIDAMSKSVLYWLIADFGNRTPIQMATILQKRIKQWKKVFGSKADDIALWFVKSVKKHTEFNTRNAFAEIGYRIKSEVPKEIVKAVELENKYLIDSIPEKYFTAIETIAMMALLYGWDKKKVSDEIVNRRDITLRRAKFIASDQSHKTTELFKRGICQRNNVWQGRWVYTWRSENPRKNHIELNGALFDLDKGCYDYYENKYVFPAQEYGCKCDFIPVVKEVGDE